MHQQDPVVLSLICMTAPAGSCCFISHLSACTSRILLFYLSIDSMQQILLFYLSSDCMQWNPFLLWLSWLFAAGSCCCFISHLSACTSRILLFYLSSVCMHQQDPAVLSLNWLHAADPVVLSLIWLHAVESFSFVTQLIVCSRILLFYLSSDCIRVAIQIPFHKKSTE
jgi:hypothetical protein